MSSSTAKRGGGSRPPSPRPRAARPPPRRPAPALPWLRWRRAVALGVGAIVLLPVAHALFGDVGSTLLAVFLLGLLCGRWSLRWP